MVVSSVGRGTIACMHVYVSTCSNAHCLTPANRMNFRGARPVPTPLGSTCLNNLVNQRLSTYNVRTLQSKQSGLSWSIQTIKAINKHTYTCTTKGVYLTYM